MTQKVNFALSPEEYDLLQARFAKSTSHSLSAFCRQIILSKPVVIRYHNATSDEFLVIALEIKQELGEIIGELRNAISSPSPPSEIQLKALVTKTDELKLIMHQIYQQWSSI
jgi:hypothetical protein